LQAKLNAKEQTAKLDEMDDKLKQRKKLIFERDQERRTKNDAHQYFKEILAKNGLYIETLQDKQRIYS
jgi:trehalose-6-phosphate synthase